MGVSEQRPPSKPTPAKPTSMKDMFKSTPKDSGTVRKAALAHLEQETGRQDGMSVVKQGEDIPQGSGGDGASERTMSHTASCRTAASTTQGGNTLSSSNGGQGITVMPQLAPSPMTTAVLVDHVPPQPATLDGILHYMQSMQVMIASLVTSVQSLATEKANGEAELSALRQELNELKTQVMDLAATRPDNRKRAAPQPSTETSPVVTVVATHNTSPAPRTGLNDFITVGKRGKPLPEKKAPRERKLSEDDIEAWLNGNTLSLNKLEVVYVKGFKRTPLGIARRCLKARNVPTETIRNISFTDDDTMELLVFKEMVPTLITALSTANPNCTHLSDFNWTNQPKSARYDSVRRINSILRTLDKDMHCVRGALRGILKDIESSLTVEKPTQIPEATPASATARQVTPLTIVSITPNSAAMEVEPTTTEEPATPTNAA